MSDNIISSSISSKERILSIFDALSYPAGSYCESFSAPACPRPHWHSLLETLDKRGRAALEVDHERARRMRHEDGATINPFDDLTEQTTSWALDMIPFPVSAQEWARIEVAVKQRANLLEKILADTYGPQNLLKGGKIAADLVFANPNFLHSCHGIKPPGNRYLTFYAVDIYRSSDGQFKVLSDHGAKPAGLGYALENRIVMSRLFSDLYHKTQIRRLAPFFQTFHNAFMERSSLRKDEPGIVLLTPGPDSPIYFEHALLSRYLGYPLVEGQDLTVRNGKVFLKKLAGLEPVEAIFRQVDDHDSDPFTLRRATSSGVAGLIQVCREQNIDVVNPLGSGFIETPALQVFLPDLCRDLLGEELLLSNHPAWWGGDPEWIPYILNNISKLEVFSAMERHGRIDSSTETHAVIAASPAKYLASSPLVPAVLPTWNGKGVSVGSTIIRIFACATEHGFSVMPGGLAITASDTATLLTECPEKQQSKDVWVLSDEPIELFSMMAGLTSIPVFKRTSDLPNRVADNLLWLGRYLERAEGLVRLLRAVFKRLSGEERPEEVPELQFLLNILQTKNIIPKPVAEGSSLSLEVDEHLKNALYRRDRAESVLSILRRVQQTAHNVRDRLSLDSIRVINRMEDFREGANIEPLDLLDQTLFTLSSFSGLAMESMTRGLGWNFMDMGRRIERALNQAMLIRIGLPLVCKDSHNTLQALLEVSDSLMTYRGRYRSSFQLAPVLDLLLADEGNPKSLAFQFNQLARHVDQLPHQEERRFASKEERTVLEMQTAIRLFDLSAIHCGEEISGIESLTVFLNLLETQLKEFAEQVSAHYLTRVPSTPHYAMRVGDHSL
jgi:uncharacterized circularly permuted ATP-grasp superfamily protein/uncharacterized alpha-E superfamily protein